jgi:hypothetical protein
MSSDDMESSISRSLSDEPLQSIPSMENIHIHSIPTRKEHVESVIINYMKPKSSTVTAEVSKPPAAERKKKKSKNSESQIDTVPVSSSSSIGLTNPSTIKNPGLKIETSNQNTVPVVSMSPTNSENKFAIDDDITKKLRQAIVKHADNFHVPDWIASSPSNTQYIPNSPKGNQISSPTTPSHVTSKDHLKIIISSEGSHASPLKPPSSPKKSRASAPTSPTSQNTGWH